MNPEVRDVLLRRLARALAWDACAVDEQVRYRSRADRLLTELEAGSSDAELLELVRAAERAIDSHGAGILE